MRRSIGLLGCLFVALSARALAQEGAHRVRGTVLDDETGEPLAGVHVMAFPAGDSTRVQGDISTAAGRFTVAVRRPGPTVVRISYVGYSSVRNTLTVRGEVQLGVIRLRREALPMDQVLVEAVQERVVLKGDTTEYNAAAFQVTADADAEALVAKMPGITVEGGSVKAQGEEVRRVLVDGREFFSDDPVAALRNLPAEIIDRVQVFDRMSEQAQFTGFDDGQTEKTINVLTLQGRNVGQFGKLFGGYGAEQRYNSGGNVNVFDGARRISLIGLSNNVNQQNFATEDLLGVIGAGGRRGGGGFSGRGMGGGSRGGGGGMRGGGGGPGGGDGRGGGMRSDPRNFLVSDQGGINSTNALGLNYNDEWSSKVRVSGSYFFNKTGNLSEVSLDREYLLASDEAQLYSEQNRVDSDNFNHRLSMRVQVNFDESNSLVFTPRLSLQSNRSLSALTGKNTLEDLLLSATTNDYDSDNAGYTSSSDLLFRHRFPKNGRTLSANLSVGLNDRAGDSDLYAANRFFSSADSSIVDQRTHSEQGGLTLSTNLVYTEPLGPNGQLQVNYSPSVSNSDSDRLTNGLDVGSGEYTMLDPVLSNTFDNRTTRQRAGANYRFRKGVLVAQIGVDLQDLRLTGDQTFPVAFRVDRSFRDALPNAMLQLRFSRTNNLRLFYRSSTNTPSISQLQNVIDNTNPLQLSSGNPDLEQSTTQTVMLRYNKTRPQQGRVFMAYTSFSASDHTIGTESFIAPYDTLIAPGVLLAQGSQYSRPVNIGKAWNTRSLVTLGLPSGLLRSNVNLNAGYTYTRSPGLINGLTNVSGIHSLSSGIVIGSNVSRRLDFTLSYTLNVNLVRNEVYSTLEADYTFHRYSLRFNWLPSDVWVFESTLNGTQYAGLGASYAQTNVLWNAALGRKFLKSNRGEVKVIVTDILGRNNNISRTVTELYIEDNRTNVLGRYVLLNVGYRLRNFGSL